MDKKSILVIDDDRNILAIIEMYLKKEGCTVTTCERGDTALEAFHKAKPDLVVLDVMLPGMDGWGVLGKIREESDVPVIMLTAKSDTMDRIQGLDLGADDYMVKPVNVNEMVLRVGALLRRAQMANERRQIIGGTVLECDSLSVHTGNETMTLPQKEFMLLYKMVSFPGRIFTRQQLMDDIWGYSSETDTHTVDVHIGRLRERFRDNPDFKIVTMRGVGYKVVKL